MRGLKSTATDARKAAAEKAVDGCAGLPQAGGIGHPDHTAVPEQAQRCVPFVRPWAHGPGAPPVLPVRRPQVQQSHEVGFAGLLRGVPARRFHAFFLSQPPVVSTSGSMSVPPVLKALHVCLKSVNGIPAFTSLPLMLNFVGFQHRAQLRSRLC